MSAGELDRNAERAREQRSYRVGLAAAALLTAVPFGLVATGAASAATAYWIIGLLALVQAVVHFRFFLHIGLDRSTRDDLQLILFTVLIIVLMAGGTVWILAHLHERMM